MSTPPSASTAASTKRSQLSGIGDVELERDVGVDAVDPARAAGDPGALAPAASRTIAAPIPLDAPVTIAVLPSSFTSRA